MGQRIGLGGVREAKTWHCLEALPVFGDEGSGCADEGIRNRSDRPFQGNFTVLDQDLEDRRLQDCGLPLREDEQGVTLVEYGILVGLIALASVVTLTSLKGNIATLMSAVGSQIMSST